MPLDGRELRREHPRRGAHDRVAARAIAVIVGVGAVVALAMAALLSCRGWLQRGRHTLGNGPQLLEELLEGQLLLEPGRQERDADGEARWRTRRSDRHREA